MVTQDVVIVGSARTPVAKFNGGLSSLSAMQLGGVAVAGALERAGADGAAVDQVYMGHVLQAGQGQITARQAASEGGVPMTVPATTINKVCLSGLTAVQMARQQILMGEAQTVLAGGMESMTNAPYLLPKARQGLRMGNGEVVDSLIHDGLWCAFEHEHMGAGTDRVNAELGLTRQVADEWSALSHERAVAAWKEGRFADEVAPVTVPQRRGEDLVVDADEGMRPGTTAEKLAGLRPAFTPDGTITAGNASQVSDGAAALLVTSAEHAQAEGWKPLARILSYGSVAGPDASLPAQPANAIQAACKKVDLDPRGLDRYEINEAFASVAIHSGQMLGLPGSKLNVNGGAVALGHPIGATGARLLVTLLNELRQVGGGRGAAALCGGGGQGDALIVEVDAE